MRPLVAASVLLPIALAAFADEPFALSGRHGLAPFRFEAGNAGVEPIACGASVAHWFSLELGRADPGRAVATELWSEPASGAVFAINASGDRMAVEALWCGFEGRAWETAAHIALKRRAETPAPDIRVICRAAGSRLSCF
ncbi:MAG: hypothetical protein M3453_02585 [Pseudomonadota bacterium]|nr:hypothetical protein [Pseudomonadota bacterium]